MSIYTICNEFVENCCDDGYYAWNILFEFPKDNGLRIAIDKEQRYLLGEYIETCKRKRSKLMTAWIKELVRNINRNVEFVSIGRSSATGKMLCAQIAGKTPSPRKLVAWSRMDYDSISIGTEIVLIDREETRKDIGLTNTEASNPGVHIVNKITAGQGSNIIIGSQMTDSMNNLKMNIAQGAAHTLKELADCVEAAGNLEAGETFDKITSKINSGDKDEKSMKSLVTDLFSKIPDVAKLGKSVEEIVKMFIA